VPLLAVYLLGVAMIGIGFAFASPYRACSCHAAVSVMWFVPTRRVVKQS